MQFSESSVEDLQDIQSEADHRRITIDQVGIKGLRLPVRVRTKTGGLQSSVATVTLTVELPARHKGTHMSRFVESLHEVDRPLDSEGLRALLRDLRLRLKASHAHAICAFPFFTEKLAPVTKAKGLMDYNVTLEGGGAEGDDQIITRVSVPVTTLCPCSKAISVHGAHNQRGEVTFSVRSERNLWIEDLIVMAESSASSELYSLLKRPDEKAVTERAFLNPVFVEDLVRNLALQADAHPDILWYRIEAENFESIHNHNAYAVIERRLDRQKTTENG